MLCGKIRILNFDNSVVKQKKLLENYHPAIVNLQGIGPFCRHWMGKNTAETIRNHLEPELKNAITFLGSGDFHHISNLLIGQFHEPLSVIVFDHHPDWDIYPPKLGCGSWITRVLERPNILKVILYSSNQIQNPFIGNKM